MSIASRQHLLRQLDELAVRLLARCTETDTFWRAYHLATARLLRRASVGERSWLLECSRLTLAIHGIPACDAILGRALPPHPHDGADNGDRR